MRGSLLLMALAAIARMATPAVTAASRPNIIFILADDLGIECPSTYGGRSYRTPSIDRLAAEGMKFTHCFSNPLCSPSRAQLLTGRYPLHNGIRRVIWDAKQHREFLDPEQETSFANLLKDAGYATAIAGKWQVSFLFERDTVRSFGFDEYQCWKIMNPDYSKNGRYADPVYVRNGTTLRGELKGTYGPDKNTSFLIDFMRRNKDRSFLACYTMLLPHFPWEPTPDSKAPLKAVLGQQKGNAKYFPDMVAYMDKLVGRIATAVDELGLERKTVIIFSGDNGTQQPLQSRWGPDNRIVKGGKGKLSDTGTRVPLIARWTGTIKAGSECHDLVDFSDFLPTFVELAGAQMPRRRVNGRSFLPQLQGKEGRPREWIHVQNMNRRYVRSRDWILTSAGGLRPTVELGMEAAKPVQGALTGGQKAVKQKLERALREAAFKDSQSRGFEPGEGYSLLGTVAPRHARSIKASNWSVGAETMGRDYTVYANWNAYLGPLGVKKARIQSGWAKTERQKGRYDWSWLDEIIPDMVAQGVEPWVCLCYGNPIYPEGGGTGLAGGLPKSKEALEAWDRYVAAFVDRYKGQIDEWEIWNEPGLHGSNGAQVYADFFIRTARGIRRNQPGATIVGLALPGIPLPFTKAFLDHLKQKGALKLLDVVSYHPYSYNPDDSYAAVEKLRSLVRSYSPDMAIFQGENGAPSEGGKFGALSGYDWDEERQAKWALRRLLGDLGHDIPSSYFAICDMVYLVGEKGRDSDLRDDRGKVRTRLNRKGLLAVKADKTIDHPKTAYRAVQHVTAIFDGSLERVRENSCKLRGGTPETRYPAFHYRSDTGGDVITLWRGRDRPGQRTELERLELTVKGGRFKDPVLVDMLSGKVFAMDEGLYAKRGNAVTFTQVPLYDSVVLLADRSAVPLQTAQ